MLKPTTASWPKSAARPGARRETRGLGFGERVHGRFEGETVWESAVLVFELSDHPWWKRPDSIGSVEKSQRNQRPCLPCQREGGAAEGCEYALRPSGSNLVSCSKRTWLGYTYAVVTLPVHPESSL